MAVIVLALGAPVGAAAAAASAGSLVAATSLSAPQGGTVTIAGNVSPSGTCTPGSTVQLTTTPTSGTANLFPDGLGPQLTTDASGNFHTSLVIPATAPVGSYTLGIRCGTANVATNEILTVTAHTPPSITVSPGSIQAGNAITVTGVVPTTGASSCPSGDAVVLTSTAALFPPSGSGPQAGRDGTGNFHTSYTVPAATAAGSYSIGVRCGGGNVGVTATLQVTASATTTTTTVPATTTTVAPAPTTTVASGTTTTVSPVPTTTTVPSAHGKTTSKTHSLRWVALGVLVLVLLIALVVYFVQR